MEHLMIISINICIGAGRGLHYLHTGTGIDSGVIHRDVKSSNILLHESWAAKIADFGLSKIGPTNQPYTYVNTLVKGSFGYFDPDYFTTGRLTRKSDVYAFGVVLLEVLCRKRAVDTSLDEDQWGLVTWVQDSIKEGNLNHIIDSDIRVEISSKCLKEFVTTAERCLHKSPKQRPTMAEVLFSLESVLALQEKFNNSLQSAGKTIFGRMLDMLPFSSNRENSKMKEVPVDFQSPSPSVKEFRFSDLKEATSGFSQDLLLDLGGYKNMFLGWLEQDTLAPSKQGVGIAVIVKRSASTNGSLRYRGWQAEVNILGQLAHPNVIKLLGCCNDKEHLIVYEYMSNKSLAHFLFTDNIGDPLSWGTRLLIILQIIRVARGLAYLHSKKVIYRDLKPVNISLDEEFNAKLWDFELAKLYGPEAEPTKIHVTSMLLGTYGYTAPEYLMTGHLSMKCDIYSFGVVVLESMSGRRVKDYKQPNGKQYLVEWVTHIKPNKRNLNKIMDPRLEHNYPLQGALECIALALRCVTNKPKDRPSSEEVLQSLEQIYALHK